jgi:hypothetical protein
VQRGRRSPEARSGELVVEHSEMIVRLMIVMICKMAVTFLDLFFLAVNSTEMR